MISVVLDSGPNTGKTTLIQRFAGMGFSVINEKAAEVIQQGGPLPWDDYDAFQFEVLCRQLCAEQNQEAMRHPLGVRFLDRCVYSGVIYRLLLGLKVPDFFSRLPVRNRYDVCLVPELVPCWHSDGVRYEDPTFTRDIIPVFHWFYARVGVPTVSVPFFETVDERQAFVLDKLGVNVQPEQVASALAA